jgi:hypothetical protein
MGWLARSYAIASTGVRRLSPPMPAVESWARASSTIAARTGAISESDVPRVKRLLGVR